MANSNPKVTPYAINAKGGVMTNIVLTIMASKADVIEDPSLNAGVPQGLTGYYIDTQPPQGVIPVSAAQIPAKATPQAIQVWLPNNNGQLGVAYEPIILGGQDGRVHGGLGGEVGADGTVILQLTTNSATAGGVLLREWA